MGSNYDDRNVLAMVSPTWFLKRLIAYANSRQESIAYRTALANQSDLPFISALGDVENLSYTVASAYGIFEFSLSRTAAEAEYVNLASKERTAHILEGDATGGGHAWFGGLKSFTNGLTGAKTMFPISWSNKKIMNAISEVAVNNDWVQQTGPAGSFFTRSGAPSMFVVIGSYDGLKIKVITTANDIITAYPLK